MVEAATSTHAEILRSAARIFAQVGYRAATMQGIASAAGFTPPTLYAHFGSKQGIFEGLVDALTAELYAVLGRELPKGLTLAQFLELRIRDVLELAERQRDVFVMVIVRPYDLPDLDPVRDDHALLQRHWESIFEERRDELSDRTATEAALLLEGVLYASVKLWLRSGEDRIAHRTPRLVDMILHGLGSSR